MATKKKLLFINQTLGTGGAEVFLVDLLEALKKLNWEIIVYSNNKVFRRMLKEKDISVRKINTVVDIVGNWKGLVKGLFLWPILLYEYLSIFYKEKDVEVFLTSGFIEKILASPLAKLFKKETFWIEFGPMASLLNKFYKLPKFLYSLVTRLPRKIIVPSHNTKKHIIKQTNIHHNKLQIIACGENLNAIYVKENILPKNKNLVVCVSRLEKGKGQDLLIKAFKKVIEKIPSAKLKIIGEGSFREKLNVIIKKEKLEKNVELCGRVKDSIFEMKKAKMIVFPSVWDLEGFGLVMIEAMSIGKPLIAFNSGPTPEIILDKINGFLVQKNNTEELANKIILLLRSKVLREKLGKNGVKLFQKKYQILTIAKQYNEVLLEIVKDE